MISKKVLLVSFIFSVSLLPIKAQISEGGIPPSFNDPVSLRSLPSELNVEVNLNVDRLKWENEISTNNGAPLKVAEVIPLQLDMENSGEWRYLADSTYIWQKSITAKDAQGIIISYDDFYIPEGGKLFIYNKDKTHILGAYTHKTNPKGGAFATEAIWGDSFTLEYVSSKESSELPRIVIESIGYMYERVMLDDPSRYTPMINTPHPQGGSVCRINVNCVDGTNWRNQQRGVVLYFVKLYDGWHACTGSLVNNTNNDGKPYVLTASHCFNYDPNWDSMIVYFNHEFPGCENLDVMPDYKSITGGVPLVYVPLNNTGSDTFLFELKERVPNEWKPFYNGWDRRPTAPKHGVVIHHPNKDVKKIITYNRELRHGTHGGARNAHWEAIYDGRSVTEQGSSGSPIFNENGLITGTLTGGYTFCDQLYASDFYGKLWYAWDQFNQDLAYEQKLKVYLDPNDTGVDYLQGYDPNGATGIEEDIEAEIQKDLIIFPNPVEDQLHINANSIIRKVQIFTIDGKLVSDTSGSAGSTATLNTTELPKGVYTIKVYTDNNQLTEKFIKR